MGQAPAKHEMQHADAPTWCIHCGTFDIFAATTDCVDDRSERYDARNPKNWSRMFRDTFGAEVAK